MIIASSQEVFKKGWEESGTSQNCFHVGNNVLKNIIIGAVMNILLYITDVKLFHHCISGSPFSL